MIRFFRCFAGLAALAILLVAQPTAAQQESATTVDEVTITAARQTQEEKIEAFVETTTVKSPTGQLGRWDREICPTVINVVPKAADMIYGRIAEVAADVGLTIGPPGCKPNIFIVGTGDSKELLERLVEINKKLFLDDQWAIRVSRSKLQEFINAEYPVKAWFVTRRVTWEGNPYEAGANIQGRGRIRSTVRADFSHVVVVLDVSRIRTVRFPALVDYITMVSLAQINPDAELPPNVPSVLRLFEYQGQDLSQASGLTTWDRALLKGLYSATRGAKRASTQRLEIEQIMKDSLGAPQ